MSETLKIISGGQTGVDRAALDAALDQNISCGGYCPEGRRAEDGEIPPHYPLQELEGGGYKARTRKNVLAADGTVIIYFGSLAGGTEQTLKYCRNEKKPYLLIDANEIPPERAGSRISTFYRTFAKGILNVAGPRASSKDHAYGYTFAAINYFIREVNQNASNKQNQADR